MSASKPASDPGPDSAAGAPHDVAVVGGGGAGTMAFLRAVLNHDRSALFLGDAATKKRGRATWVMQVDNVPGMHDLKRPIGSSTASTLKWIEQQEGLRDRATVIKSAVTRVERRGDRFVLHHDVKGEARTLEARFVILATGVMDVQPEIGGSIEPIFPYANRGDVLYCVRCDGHQAIGHRLSVIGHGPAAVGLAALMHERYGHERITVLGHGREPEVSASARRLVEAYGIEIHPQPIVEILGDPKADGLRGYRLEGGTTIETTRSIVALGTIVHHRLLTELGGEVDADGRVVVGEAYETSVPGLFAVGDLVAGRKLQIYTAWDEAVDAADEVDRRLRARRREAALEA